MAISNVNLTTTSGLINTLRVHYAEKMLVTTRQKCVWYNLCDTDPERMVSSMNGPYIVWSRLKKLNEGKTLSQGTTPAGSTLSVEQVTGQLIQKGDIVYISDILLGTTLMRKLDNTIYEVSDAIARTVDGIIERAATIGSLREDAEGYATSAYLSDYHISTIVKSGYAVNTTNVTFPYITFSGSNTMDPIANTTFGNYSEVGTTFTNSNMGFTIAKLQGAVNYLLRQDAEPWPDTYFRAVIHPNMVHLIERDPEFLLWNQYGNADTMGYLNSEVGAVAKVRLLASNRARVFGTMFSATAACSGYVTTICGIRALATIEHEEESIVGSSADKAAKGLVPSVIINTSKNATLADPLAQIAAAVGYKLFAGAKVIDTQRGVNLLQFRFSASDRF